MGSVLEISGAARENGIRALSLGKKKEEWAIATTGYAVIDFC